MSITKAQSQTAVKRVNIDKQFWKIKIRKFGFSTRLSLVDLVETDVKSIFSIKKRYCKSAGLEFSQFLFSGKCLYFTLSIIFAAYRILIHILVFGFCLFLQIPATVLASFVSAENPCFLWRVIFPSPWLWLLERISLWISAVWLWLFFFVFVLLLVCWASWIYKLIFFHRVWKIPAIISSDSFSS